MPEIYFLLLGFSTILNFSYNNSKVLDFFLKITFLGIIAKKAKSFILTLYTGSFFFLEIGLVYY